MSHKDYYLILGIPRDEELRGIRAAYRELAKKHHPDRAGTEATRAFQEIEEAYRILSDPEARREYNALLHRRETPVSRPRPAPRRAAPGTDALLVPQSIPIFGHQESVSPSFDALWDRLRRNFFDEPAPKGERAEELVFEVILTPAEATQGGVIPVGIPVFHRCPECGGAGHAWGFSCSACLGQGFVEGEETAYVRYPPMVRHGAILEVPLRSFGIDNLHLRLHIVIGG